ncbi:MAG: hypothetical protein IPN76_30820 [Saprospiraceae bacterium]|nr:hypothetical protein [Saprospiraceae bacterium]
MDRFWEDGDHNVKDFVNMRHLWPRNTADELARPGWFIWAHPSERLLADPQGLERVITPAIRAEVLEHLSAKDKKPYRAPEDPTKAAMKEIYLSNGGMHHYIHREHGTDYSASPVDELIWKRELLDDVTQRLENH